MFTSTSSRASSQGPTRKLVSKPVPTVGLPGSKPVMNKPKTTDDTKGKQAAIAHHVILCTKEFALEHIASLPTSRALPSAVTDKQTMQVLFVKTASQFISEWPKVHNGAVINVPLTVAEEASLRGLLARNIEALRQSAMADSSLSSSLIMGGKRASVGASPIVPSLVYEGKYQASPAVTVKKSPLPAVTPVAHYTSAVLDSTTNTIATDEPEIDVLASSSTFVYPEAQATAAALQFQPQVEGPASDAIVATSGFSTIPAAKQKGAAVVKALIDPYYSNGLLTGEQYSRIVMTVVEVYFKFHPKSLKSKTKSQLEGRYLRSSSGRSAAGTSRNGAQSPLTPRGTNGVTSHFQDSRITSHTSTIPFNRFYYDPEHYPNATVFTSLEDAVLSPSSPRHTVLATSLATIPAKEPRKSPSQHRAEAAPTTYNKGPSMLGLLGKYERDVPALTKQSTAHGLNPTMPRGSSTAIRNQLLQSEGAFRLRKPFVSTPMGSPTVNRLNVDSGDGQQAAIPDPSVTPVLTGVDQAAITQLANHFLDLELKGVNCTSEEIKAITESVMIRAAANTADRVRHLPSDALSGGEGAAAVGGAYGTNSSYCLPRAGHPHASIRYDDEYDGDIAPSSITNLTSPLHLDSPTTRGSTVTQSARTSRVPSRSSLGVSAQPTPMYSRLATNGATTADVYEGSVNTNNSSSSARVTDHHTSSLHARRVFSSERADDNHMAALPSPTPPSSEETQQTANDANRRNLYILGSNGEQVPVHYNQAGNYYYYHHQQQNASSNAPPMVVLVTDPQREILYSDVAGPAEGEEEEEEGGDNVGGYFSGRASGLMHRPQYNPITQPSSNLQPTEPLSTAAASLPAQSSTLFDLEYQRLRLALGLADDSAEIFFDGEPMEGDLDTLEGLQRRRDYLLRKFNDMKASFSSGDHYRADIPPVGAGELAVGVFDRLSAEEFIREAKAQLFYEDTEPQVVGVEELGGSPDRHRELAEVGNNESPARSRSRAEALNYGEAAEAEVGNNESPARSRSRVEALNYGEEAEAESEVGNNESPARSRSRVEGEAEVGNNESPARSRSRVEALNYGEEAEAEVGNNESPARSRSRVEGEAEVGNNESPARSRSRVEALNYGEEAEAEVGNNESPARSRSRVEALNYGEEAEAEVGNNESPARSRSRVEALNYGEEAEAEVGNNESPARSRSRVEALNYGEEAETEAEVGNKADLTLSATRNPTTGTFELSTLLSPIPAQPPLAEPDSFQTPSRVLALSDQEDKLFTELKRQREESLKSGE